MIREASALAARHDRLERVQSEATLAAEFATKMTMARSFPDAAAVYQEWASRQLKLAVEDASYAISAGQALMDMGSRLLQGEDKDKDKDKDKGSVGSA